MLIKILWTGCQNCIKLESNVKIALEKTWIESWVEKITDISNIMAYWIMSTPWLVIDEKVISSWKVNNVDEIITFLKNEKNSNSKETNISAWCCSNKNNSDIKDKTENIWWCSCDCNC